MFRLFRTLFTLAVIAIVVVGAYLWIARVPTLERFLSKKLGVKVSIDDVNLSWSRFSIERLRIENPGRGPSSFAFETREISVELSPLEIWKKTLHIHQVTLHDPTLTLELYNSSGKENNWVRILNGLPSSSDRHFIIDKLTITNLKFQAIRSKGKTLSIPPIRRLNFENLGYNSPLSLGQVGKIVFQGILKSLTPRPYLGSILDRTRVVPKDLLKGIFPVEEERGVFRDSLTSLKRKGLQATEFLYGLFNN